MKKRRRQQAGRQESARQAGAGGRQAGTSLPAHAYVQIRTAPLCAQGERSR